MKKVPEERFKNIRVLMQKRCYDENHKSYERYGGRGITVCNQWLESFEKFKEDMWESYCLHFEKFGKINTTIERKDNNKGYSPDNCIWATQKTQANNRRDNVLITYLNRTQTLIQWAEEVGMNPTTLSTRLKKYGIEKAFALPVDFHKILITYKNVTHNVHEWSKITGMRQELLARRHRNGWSPEEIFERPVNAKDRVFIYKGMTKTIPEWASYLNIEAGIIRQRMRRQKMSFEEAIETPIESTNRFHTYNNMTMTLKEWAIYLGIDRDILYRRLGKLGWSIEKTFSTPKLNKGKH